MRSIQVFEKLPTYPFPNSTDLATERERQLTTGKRAERTTHDFLCQIAVLLLVKSLVWFLRAVIKWRSRSVAKSALYSHFAHNVGLGRGGGGRTVCQKPNSIQKNALLAMETRAHYLFIYLIDVYI